MDIGTIFKEETITNNFNNRNLCQSVLIRENPCYAFGEQLKKLGGSAGSPTGEAKYTYGGKELDDETNLYYFNARFYDATIGRFINVDPVQDGTNWYIYCSNNPLSMVDPTGLEKEGFWEGATFYNKKIDNSYEFNKTALNALSDNLHNKAQKTSRGADWKDTGSEVPIPILDTVLSFFSRVDSRNAGIIEEQAFQIQKLLNKYNDKDYTAKINYQMFETDLQGDNLTGYYTEKKFQITLDLIDNETGKSLLENPQSFSYSDETIKQLEKFNSSKTDNMEQKKSESIKLDTQNRDVHDDVTIE